MVRGPSYTLGRCMHAFLHACVHRWVACSLLLLHTCSGALHAVTGVACVRWGFACERTSAAGVPKLLYYTPKPPAAAGAAAAVHAAAATAAAAVSSCCDSSRDCSITYRGDSSSNRGNSCCSEDTEQKSKAATLLLLRPHGQQQQEQQLLLQQKGQQQQQQELLAFAGCLQHLLRVEAALRETIPAPEERVSFWQQRLMLTFRCMQGLRVNISCRGV